MQNAVPGKILVLAHDAIFPANHGYRIDVARRLEKLSSLGFEIGLICLSREHAEGAAPADFNSFKLFRCFGRDDYLSPWISQLRRPDLPWPTSARVLREDRMNKLLAEVINFSPSSIMVEGLYSFNLARNLISKMPAGVRILYRSHNIEHLYMLGQLRAAVDMRSKLNLALCVKGLKRFEYDALAESQQVLDISWEDAEFWKRQFGSRVACLPPLPQRGVPVPRSTIDWDIAYCGNLNAPNNIEAVSWFVREVWSRMPDAPTKRPSIVLAGSNPSAAIHALVRECPALTLISNPDSMDDIYARSGVLINPALHGSGVNIKTIDMIYSGRPIIVSRVAVKGLSPTIAKLIAVAETTEDWVAALSATTVGRVVPPVRLVEIYQAECDQAHGRLVKELTH